MTNDETEQAAILQAALEFVECRPDEGTKYVGWRPDRWSEVARVLYRALKDQYRALKDQKPASNAPRHAPPLEPNMTWEPQPAGHYAREVKA